MTSRLLRIYLQDHHAASAAGVALARRALGPHHSLAKQIARDREALEGVMRQLSIAPSAIKVGVAHVAERAGRMKLNGSLFKRSTLSSVVELETLVVGVRGKEALWTALQRANVRLEDNLEALVESARAQGAELDALRLSAAARAFARTSGEVSDQQPTA
jgi:alcohol dehydrogenase class IV